MPNMDLGELINSARGDRSFRQLADQSERAGTPLSAARWQQLGSGRRSIVNIPDRPTLRSIAQVLGVPERVVLFAAAETVGIDLNDRDSPLHSLLPADVRRLTDRQLLAVLAVVQAFLDPGESGADPDNPDHFVLPDVTSPPPPNEPSAARRAAQRRTPGHGA